MLVPPMNEVSNVLFVLPGWSSFASSTASSVGRVCACGVMIARIPSTPGSFATSAIVRRNSSGVASPMISAGFPRLQASGANSLMRSTVALSSFASSPPYISNASVESTPGPPAFVTMPSLGPRGGVWDMSTFAIPKRSSMVSTRRTPARSKAVSNTLSDPASDPVWLAEAAAPAEERPDFMTMTGFSVTATRAAVINRRASPIASM
mmetsp:Transcript_124545/g.346756  ORF Transcript_124545/g.346756 Transcript_124545/m.346756 type:complete len:207 (-) Transcript_124545:820-1440(-)